MQLVSLRDFQRKSSDYLGNLPITLTVNEKPIATLLPVTNQDNDVLAIVKENLMITKGIMKYVDSVKEKQQKKELEKEKIKEDLANILVPRSSENGFVDASSLIRCDGIICKGKRTDSKPYEVELPDGGNFEHSVKNYCPLDYKEIKAKGYKIEPL